ncbi:TasA family protein [Shouchella clausii]|uniref:Uncharacterized protein n=1 Tax=Shouchella clausii TaxID=79880 RepID=A0A268RXE9_SHOCL|nr:TasA family protein [Shouchella clausii]PAD44226.1 hypothetical protein CHH54_02950 [Bacillus sp. 7520-S]SPU21242.1 Uncharacterised protein [Niallia circulans]AST94925.1 hypothetical protein BC8716_02585 [Shouchella clausii]MBU8596263.1 M73 family metallopeptidase [Shouchella clausii]MCM3549303.1 CalY family protein [Shouchella clausii]
MKKVKSLKLAMIATAFVGALVIVLGSGGSFSWFTGETSATGEIKNGTLEINHGEDIDGNIVQAESFAPSQLIFGDWLSIENTGTLDTHLQATYDHSVDLNVPIDAYKVGYIAIKYTTTPGRDVYEDAQYKLDQLFNGITNEVQSFSHTAEANGVEVVAVLIDEQAYDENADQFVLGDGSLQGPDNEFWQLDEGQYIDLNFGVKLDENAGNEYQGAVYTASLEVLAKQTDQGAK